nr:MAG TPA: hypothetical protein [Herelleviridae sp.]
MSFSKLYIPLYSDRSRSFYLSNEYPLFLGYG